MNNDMLLEIDNWRSVGDLQYRFNKCFPNLNLQFFDPKNARISDYPLSSAILLEHIRRGHNQGILNIKSWFTKNEVEALLRNEFGICAKVVPAQDGRSFADRESGKLPLSELNKAAGFHKSVPASLEDADELVYGY